MFSRNNLSISLRAALILSLLVAPIMVMPAFASGSVFYVKWDASGANDGTSWADAFTDLQSALAAASSGDEIWVAAGTYQPTSGTDRTVSFVLKNDIAVYGGFAGTETSVTQRDYQTNVTILNGDIGVADDTSDNSYHVIVGSNTSDTTVLDGFTITGGNADDLSDADAWGGGMYVLEGNPQLFNLIFTENTATSGGGIALDNSISVLTDVTFQNNSAQGGGGILVVAGTPTFSHVTVSGNTANSGGGMAVSNSNPILENVTFYGNMASTGAGIYIYGNPVLINVSFSGNIASVIGGGLYNESSTPTIINSIFWGNTGGEIENFDENTPNVSYSIVQGGYPGIGNINSDPLLGSLQDNGGVTQTMALLPSSPAIDAGDDVSCPPTDQRGIVRPQGDHCDIGAFEYELPPTSTPTNTETSTPTASRTRTPTRTPTATVPTSTPTVTRTRTPTITITPTFTPTFIPTATHTATRTPTVTLLPTETDTPTYTPTNFPFVPVLYVDRNAMGENNGTSWANAYTDLQSALFAATNGQEIWVAAGTYKPTTSSDRSISFALKNGVAVYGGFAGTETSLSQRENQTNLTILSGDIGIESDNSDNSYHVVVGSNTDTSTVLDGFTITGGNANVSPSDKGGGMYNFHGSPSLANLIFTDNYARFGGGMNNESTSLSDSSNPHLSNVSFIHNSAVEGGGMRNMSYSSPTLENVKFQNNTVIRAGGGMVNMYQNTVTMRNVEFSGNMAGTGGGLANAGSNPILENVTFSNNSAEWGGAISNGHSSPTIINATFYGNSATTYGGAISNESNSNPILTNVTISGNSAVTFGGGMYNDSNSVIVRNSIVYGNSGGAIYNGSGNIVVSYSIVQGGYPGTGNIDADPLLGALQDNGGFTQTMTLGVSSPAIDAADGANCPETDQRGVSRPQWDGCDIGAFEYVFSPMSTPPSTLTPTITATTTPILYTISGNAGVAGALLSYVEDGMSKNVMSGSNGNYSFMVKSGWSGMVTPSKSSHFFTPASRTYADVVTDIPSQNYTATVIVMNTDDSGPGSLRQAISDSAPETTIYFDQLLSGQVITLASQLYINKDLTLDGSGLNPHVSISGNQSVRIISIGSNYSVTLQSLILKDGKRTGTSYTESGGAIYTNNATTLMLMDVAFVGNTAYQAGAIYVSPDADVTILNSEFIANSSQSSGGAILVQSIGGLTLRNSLLQNNSAAWSGGAIDLEAAGTRILENNTFSGNTAGSGGAIMISQTSNSNITLIANLFNQNTSTNSVGGGGALRIYMSSFPALLTAENNTFYANQAANIGGAIWSEGEAILRNNTFSENQANKIGGNAGASLYLSSGFGTYLYNNILADSPIGGECSSFGSNYIAGNNNVIEDGSGPCSTLASTIISDPLLGPLADNGGSTQTMALEFASPAINTGNDVNCTVTDQRGVSRPQGDGCDIGAFEYEFLPTPVPTFVPTDTPTSTPTFTPTATLTPTMPTRTPTVTRTRTPTRTPTLTRTPTPTWTSTSTPTLIPTDTPTFTPTFTATATDTATNTPSATLTPTETYTPTDTPTLTPTETHTPTYTPTAPQLVTISLNSVAANDGWILESSENSNVGGTRNATAKTFNLGDNRANKQYVGILHFDTSSLPDNAVITSVTLRVQKQGITGMDPFTTHGSLALDVQKPYFGTTAGLLTSDFNAASAGTAVSIFDPVPVNNWYSATIDSDGYVYVNLAGTTQFRLRFTLDDDNDRVADLIKFFSGNSTAANRPQLIIQYYIP